MPKANKSSASAGTRKKNAKKAAGKDGEDGPPATKNQPKKMQRGQKKLSKAQQRALPKIKQYVPPPKPPAPPIPDPLDGQGLARTLPAELVVVLRRLGKKDDVTRRKGLEELREGWVLEIAKTGLDEEQEVERETKESALECAVPVWMHNLASLLQSPFHRNTAIQLHAELLTIPSIRSAVLDTLSLSLLPGTQNRDVLGSWLVAALEEGRRGGGAGLRSWDESTMFLREGQALNERIDLVPQLTTLIEYLSLSILDPPSLHDDIHPAPVSSAPAAAPLTKGSKGAKGKQTYTPAPPTPAEPTSEEVEMTGEKWARYRVGGLVGLAWLLQQLKTSDIPIPEELSRLIHVPALWSSLSSLSTDDDSPDFGHQHPTVRRAAYTVLGVLVDSYPEEVAKPEMLQILASEMLDTIWLEKENTVWETAGHTVVKVLSKHRDIWTMASADADTKKDDNDGKTDDDDEDDDSEDSEDEEDGVDAVDDDANAKTEQPAATNTYTSSTAFDRLLEFISTICPTLPHRTYPLLLVIISTLPPTLLPLSSLSPQTKTLFAHLWSPVDARLLSTHALPGQPSAFQAFLRDAVDCTTFLINKSGKEDGGNETKQWLVLDQLGERVWKEGVLEMGGRSAGRRTVQGVRSEQEATIFGQALARLQGSTPDLAQRLLNVVIQSTVESVSQEADAKKAVAMLPRVLSVIAAVKAVNEDESIKQKLDDLVGRVASVCAESLRSSSSTPNADVSTYTETLIDIVRSHPTVVQADTRSSVVQLVDSSSNQLTSQLSPALYVALLDALASTSDEDGHTLKRSLDRLAHSSDMGQQVRFAVVKNLLSCDSMVLSSDALDIVAEDATQIALSSEEPAATEVAAACVVSTRISPDSLHTILALVSTSFHDSVYDLLTAHPEARVPQAAVQIFAAYAQSHLAEVLASDIFSRALVGLHHLVVLLPRLHEAGHAVPTQAKVVWDETKKLEGEAKGDLSQKILSDLSGLVQDVSCRVEPSILADVALVIDSEIQPATVADRILPETSLIQGLISEFTSRTPNTTLAIVDPLVSPSADSNAEEGPSSSFDSRGRSKAARLAEAALAFIRADRQLASTSPNLLQIVLSARALAQDALAVPGASRGFLNANVIPSYLEEVIREAEGALSFSLSAFDEVSIDWHKTTVDLLKKEEGDKGDFLQRLLATLALSVKGQEDDVAARIVRDVLEKHLRQSGAGEKEAEVWLAYAMTKADKNPALALAVLLAVKTLLLDTKPFETAQNRLASSLSGIPAKHANEKGIPALRLLVASAPPPDAASVFIPQQRAIFVLRHVASWLTSDAADDLDEEVEARIAELYTVMAPIVQSVQGAHWDSIFDLIETGLDSASMEDPSTYGLMYDCLVLLREVRDLSESNKALKASWTSKKVHMSLVLQLFLQCRNADSIPIQMIQTLLLDLLRDAGDDTAGDSGLPELCELIGKSNSATVQTTAYRLLGKVVKRRTLALVLEVEASVSDVQEDQPARKIELPQGLVEIVQKGQAVDWHEEPAMELVLGQLLAWMSVLDHFDDASRTLRWGYLDQLNSSDLLVNSLLPMLFAILGVSEVGAWNFPASSFAVDEFYPDLLQPEELADLSPLASHVFYRTLVTIPSAIRTYYEGLKDRQLSMSMLNFTARHYSPVIIAHEFAALRQPSAMAQLTEEGLNIRIAQGGGATVAAGGGASEAIASYVVDEQPMEIGIRLPAEFPLRGVDVRDLRRVGVPENKWRGWLMSVQQTITSRNGLILEALTVFKKNVSLHFEGVVECAICYSIISLTDRTLPTKPCRTCKNRFHASCLYKWFNSSHSSSCPMCRSLF